MSSLNEPPGLNLFYNITLKEIEYGDIQELDPSFYQTLSQSLGKLKIEEYTGINIRLEKILNENKLNYKNLANEEKFIVDSDQKMSERKDMIIQNITNGKSKLLESISNDYKIKPVAIRFLKDIDKMIGADSEKYGPFKAEDVATLPNENAQELILRNVAIKTCIE
jgi:DNA replication factor GINS